MTTGDWRNRKNRRKSRQGQLAQMVSMGSANMTTPLVKEILGRDPRSFNQFARDFPEVFEGN